MDTQTAVRTRPLMPDFGVEILDVDVKDADEQTLDNVVHTFHRHGAIVLRGQKLTPAEQLAFTRRFGEPEGNARKEFCNPDYPEIYVISNKVVNGRPIGDPAAGLNWHTDFSYGQYPAMCTMLHALDVPPEGSDTLLADLCAAWNALPPETQKKVDGLTVHHSYAALMAKKKITLADEVMENYPDVHHPLIRRHPTDGRKALWVSTGTTRGIDGMETAEGLKLLDDMVAFATQERFIYRHKWQVGDILVWDNRCTLHRGTPFDLERHIRHVHRTWVKGEIPE